MSHKKFQVVGIGNAMVDILSEASDDFLSDAGIQKGIMQLIDLERAKLLSASLRNPTQLSGGSAANTIAGIAWLGGRTAYVGKVKSDPLGDVFESDLQRIGVTYETSRAPTDHPDETGRCTVFVTPDGERSMNTYLGVTEFLEPADIDEKMMADTDWIYLEGYRFDGPKSHEAFHKAIAATKASGGKVSLTLSDPFCVERHRDAFQTMINSHVDLLFCNRAELLSLYQTQDFSAALRAAATDIPMLACTDSENGAHVVTRETHHQVAAIPTQIKDATGAGDLFAAAFLWGIVEGHNPELCAKMGCVVASEIISHFGARPEVDLISLLKQHHAL